MAKSVARIQFKWYDAFVPFFLYFLQEEGDFNQSSITQKYLVFLLKLLNL